MVAHCVRSHRFGEDRNVAVVMGDIFRVATGAGRVAIELEDVRVHASTGDGTSPCSKSRGASNRGPYIQMILFGADSRREGSALRVMGWPSQLSDGSSLCAWRRRPRWIYSSATWTGKRFRTRWTWTPVALWSAGTREGGWGCTGGRLKWVSMEISPNTCGLGTLKGGSWARSKAARREVFVFLIRPSRKSCFGESRQ